MTTERAEQRLQQTLLQIDPDLLPPYPNISLVHGPQEQPLLQWTLGDLLQNQAQLYGNQECVVIPWTGARWTYRKLKDESALLARALLAIGVCPGDRVGIMAGNCERFVGAFFAAARIGAIMVVLNNTYTTKEAQYALKHTECKVLFTTPTIGRLDNGGLLRSISPDPERDSGFSFLTTICLFRGEHRGCLTYSEFVSLSEGCTDNILSTLSTLISTHDTCNLQFTSGSTGKPKAAMLTHHNLVNNARFIGDRMRLSPADTLCCPPPLFHCFGLTLGLLATMMHGGRVVYPSEVFDAAAVLHAISNEKCTALHGVPTMFDMILSLPRPVGWNCSRVRTGIVAGSPVPTSLMKRMLGELGMTELTSSYGLTEASPTCFNAHTYDSIPKRLATVGTIMPHAHAKIIDRSGNIVPILTRGELCIAGYQLQQGYWKNLEKTDEVMIRDQAGILWLHTGDEAMFQYDGYCTITGRLKDIIIRGGENIYPLEIEERLVQHPSILKAVVVGIDHIRYVEVPGAFLELESGCRKPSDEEVRSWVRETLGWHKAPERVFWLGKDAPAELPLTGSGKVQKFKLRKLANELVAEMERRR